METCTICFTECSNLIRLCKKCYGGYCKKCSEQLFKYKASCPLCRSTLSYWLPNNTLSFQKNRLTSIIDMEKLYISIRYNLEISKPIKYSPIINNYYVINFHDNTSNIFIGELFELNSTSVKLKNLIVISRYDGFHYLATPNIRQYDYNILKDEIFSIDNSIDFSNNFEVIKNLIC